MNTDDEQYGRPEWRPIWIVRFEPTRFNADWISDRRSRMKPPLWRFTADPNYAPTLWDEQRTTQLLQWKKLYVARLESLCFPAEWKLLARAPADPDQPPADYDRNIDGTIVTINPADADFLTPPPRTADLQRLNEGSQ